MTDTVLRDLLAGVYDADDWYDPAPRLVLADYLDETGHPAAPYARAQASHRTQADDDTARAALTKAFALPRQTQWDTGLPRRVDLPAAEVSKTAAAFRRAAVQGWVGTLILTSFDVPQADAVRKAGWLADVPRLGFRLDPPTSPTAWASAAVAELPPWPNLTHFAAENNPTFGDESVRVLGGRPSLCELHLGGSPRLTDAAVAPLAGLPDLRVLDLSGTGVARFDAEPPAFQRLRRLVFDPGGLFAGVRIRGLTRLNEVRFPAGIADVDFEDLPALNRVDLVRRVGLRRVRAVGLPSLRLLNLRGCGGQRKLKARGLGTGCRVDLTGCPALPGSSVDAVRRANPTAVVERE